LLLLIPGFGKVLYSAVSQFAAPLGGVTMSGRLVILPHKSWNVWNQDNREKVLRDERLHREAEESKAAKDRQLLQEQNLELLRSSGAVDDIPASEAPGTSVAPFRLFEDLERKHYDQLGNTEYLKEKADKDLAQKKREGIADWALGEGSYENSKSKPWYATLGNSSQQVISSNSSNPARGRENKRKEAADPMGAILVPNKIGYVPRSALPMLPLCPPVESAESKEDEGFAQSDKHDRKRSKRKHDKAEKKGHKKKDKSRDRDSQDSCRRDSGKRTKQEPAAVGGQSTCTAAEAADPWAELRKKRLEREAVERRRAALLLAEKDVYGDRGNSCSGGYSQQYNPHLARNSRW
jgi:hypothetical protein